VPRVPHDLAQHSCITIRQGDESYGLWRLSLGKRSEAVKVRGNLSTNDGEIAMNWALAGLGIVMRAEWDVARYLRSGRLRQVLEHWQTPSADIHAFYPQRHQTSARVRAFVDFVAGHFAKSSARAAGLVRAYDALVADAFGSWWRARRDKQDVRCLKSRPRPEYSRP